MSQQWFEQELRNRFERLRRHRDGFPLSIKVRVESGCFDCSSCNPYMRAFIDRLDRDGAFHGDFDFERHESGPEWIIFVAAGTVLVTFAKSLIDLVTAVIKARSDGQKKGDKNQYSIELIVRGFDQDGKLFEEKVLKLNAGDSATEAVVKNALVDGVAKHLPPPAATKPSTVNKKPVSMKTGKATRRKKK